MKVNPLRGRTVLIIEDDADYREALRHLVAALGAQVVGVADGLEGLRQVARWHPDVVFCDLTMPVMDGLEFARRMRQDPRYDGALLIAVTGRGRQSDLHDTWNSGFDGHLVKPVTVEMLGAIAQRLSDGSAGRAWQGVGV